MVFFKVLGATENPWLLPVKSTSRQLAHFCVLTRMPQHKLIHKSVFLQLDVVILATSVKNKLAGTYGPKHDDGREYHGKLSCF